MNEFPKLTMKDLEAYVVKKKKANKPIELLIDMPGFDCPEMITNPPQNIDKKMEYYHATYNDDLTHKHAKGIKIIGLLV